VDGGAEVPDVAESLGPELSPAEVARKYAIGSGQL
jgi:hypothetical protein